MAAFGTRTLVRFAQWRGRKDAKRELRHGGGGPPVFRGFIQINLVRLR